MFVANFVNGKDPRKTHETKMPALHIICGFLQQTPTSVLVENKQLLARIPSCHFWQTFFRRGVANSAGLCALQAHLWGVFAEKPLLSVLETVVLFVVTKYECCVTTVLGCPKVRKTWTFPVIYGNNLPFKTDLCVFPSFGCRSFCELENKLFCGKVDPRVKWVC